MKRIISLVVISSFLFTACNTSEKKSNQSESHQDEMAAPHSTPESMEDENSIKSIPVTFSNLDAKASAAIGEIVDNYLQIKNALADDKSKDAASEAGKLENSLKKMDKSLFTAEQMKAYDKIENELKEHAGHIEKNDDKIKQQRSHFEILSDKVYDLVKSFGAGKPIYHDYCPMAKDNQGAMWLSEAKEIKNPYMGEAMPSCGTVKEIIQ